MDSGVSRHALVIEPSSVVRAQLREFLHRYGVRMEAAECADHLADSQCLGRYHCTFVDEHVLEHPRFIAMRGCTGSPLIVLSRSLHAHRKTPCAARLRKPLDHAEVVGALAVVARMHAQAAIGGCAADCKRPALVARPAD